MSDLPKLHTLASSDNLRPGMEYIQIDGDMATVTDGHVFARVMIAEYITNHESLDGKMIHKDIWKELCRCRFIEAQGDKIIGVYNGTDIFVHFPLKDTEDKFPDWRNLLESYRTKEKKPIDTISISLGLIDRIKRGTPQGYWDNFTFHFYADNRGILLTSERFEGFALVMPTTINETSVSEELSMAKHFIKNDS